ncbi:unnamed protein product [Discosporangium mesarthrocarpum]
MSVEERFSEAVEKIKAVPGSAMSNDDKLKLYSLYKQVTVGDCNTPRPGMLDLSGKAKWDAWKALEGIGTRGSPEHRAQPGVSCRADIQGRCDDPVC